MSLQSLIIDCDPGVDDAVALLLAFASPGAGAAGGHHGRRQRAGVEKTARNARIMRQIAGREDVPVFAGAERPLVREPMGAGEFHGAEGLGDLEPFEPDAPCGGRACGGRHRRDLVMGRPTRTVAAGGHRADDQSGPGHAQASRRLAGRLGPVVVMGGARSRGRQHHRLGRVQHLGRSGRGGRGACASGCDVVMLGLDATHQVRATDDADRGARGGRHAHRRDAAAAMLRFSQRVERRSSAGTRRRCMTPARSPGC